MFPFKEITSSDDGCELLASCVIDAQQPFFQGHFPEMPIMPAVAQIDLISTLLKTNLNWDQPIVGGRALKFLDRIKPDDEVDIRLIRKSPTEILFTLKNDSTLLTKGILKLLANNDE